MKMLLKRLSPFAPDHSGAVSVLFELGGLIVICDAGGCTGNICGFDEPRWFHTKCAMFSAALRDMDAILGRDEYLVRKTASALQDTGSEFTALISTPVPAVIATDFHALKRMVFKRTGKPVIAIPAAGTGFYDSGASLAYLDLFRTFAVEEKNVKRGHIGVLGVTPLDFSRVDAGAAVAGSFHDLGWDSVVCYGMGSSLESVKNAAEAEKNFVVSPSGLAAAEYLKQKFGTPYEVCCPYLPQHLESELKRLRGKKVLVIHQQFCGNRIREILGENVTVSSFFRMEKEYMNPGDVSFSGEDSFMEFMENNTFDAVIGDPKFRRLLCNKTMEFIPFRHFAVSGELEEGQAV
jgi:hypothetical protein